MTLQKDTTALKPPAACINKSLVIPPEQHPITSNMIDRDALFVLRKLHSAGFIAYLVGGGVRDLYLGKTPKDFDISTDARPGQLRKLFPNSNTIGRRFRLVQVFFKGGKIIEVSTLRSLSEHDLDGPEQVLAPNNTFGTLAEDAQRRDLTINSLFFDIKNNTIIDYVHGVKDLQDSTVRMVGVPTKRITRDPVRMMRAIRHSARNNFNIENDTWEAICENCEKLALCPPSRLRDETLKDIYSGASSPWFSRAMSSGIFLTLFPLYRNILTEQTEAGANYIKQLTQVFEAIDRTNTVGNNNNMGRQPTFFMLALILIPWAESKYSLFSEQRKGAQLFQISKQIRADLNTSIGVELNLRRSLRQEMVTLLINLSSLIHNRADNSWPKWLRKKSYFKKCSLFYQYYIEIIEGKHVTECDLQSKTEPPAEPLKTLPARKRTSGKTKPAFAPSINGGVFGFKK